MSVSPIPNVNQPMSAYLVVKGAAAAIAFYTKAFGATELYRLVDPSDGRIGHAELSVEGAIFMVSDEYPDFGALGPISLGGSPVKLHIYVADVDARVATAVAAGATLLRPVKDEFFGDRVGQLADPFGHIWILSTHKEDVSPEEMQRRFNAAYT